MSVKVFSVYRLLFFAIIVINYLTSNKSTRNKIVVTFIVSLFLSIRSIVRQATKFYVRVIKVVLVDE